MTLRKAARLLLLSLLVIPIAIYIYSCVGISENYKVTVISDEWPGYMPVEVAKYAGYFDRYNLDVEIDYRYEFDIPEKELALNYDVSMESLPSFIADNITEFVLSTPIDISNGADGILVRDESYTDPNTWKGKTFISYGRVIPSTVLYQVLEQNGMKLNDINVLTIVPSAPHSFNYFDDPNVIGIATWEPFLRQAEAENTGSVISHTTSDYYGLISEYAVFKKDLPEQYRVAFTKAIYDAVLLLERDSNKFYKLADESNKFDISESIETLSFIDMISYDDYQRIMGVRSDGRGGLIEQYYNILVDYLRYKFQYGSDSFLPFNERIDALPINQLLN